VTVPKRIAVGIGLAALASVDVGVIHIWVDRIHLGPFDVVALALWVAQVSLLATWTAINRRRWFVRIPLLLAGLLFLSPLWHAGELAWLFTLSVQAATIIGTLGVLMLCGFKFGLVETLNCDGRNRLRLSIAHLMALTAAIAALLAMAIPLERELRSQFIVLFPMEFLLLFACSSGTVAVVAVGVVLSPVRARVRSLVGLLGLSLLLLLWCAIHPDLVAVFAIQALSGVLVAGAMLIVRRRGYRFARGAQNRRRRAAPTLDWRFRL
jgi:hypothetical protein